MSKCRHKPIDATAAKIICVKCNRPIKPSWELKRSRKYIIRTHLQGLDKQPLCNTLHSHYQPTPLTLLLDLVTCERCRAKLGGLTKVNVYQRDCSDE